MSRDQQYDVKMTAADAAEACLGAAEDIVAGYGLNATNGINAARRYLDELEARAVATARQRGVTWEQIGAHFGVTRQAAHARWSVIVGETGYKWEPVD